MSTEIAQTDDARIEFSDDPEAYTLRELRTFLEYFHDGDAELAVGAPHTDDSNRVALVSTDDDYLYAGLQGAGFHLELPEGTKTRFYVLEREEPLRHPFTKRLQAQEDEIGLCSSCWADLEEGNKPVSTCHLCPSSPDYMEYRVLQGEAEENQDV